MASAIINGWMMMMLIMIMSTAFRGCTAPLQLGYSWGVCALLRFSLSTAFAPAQSRLFEKTAGPIPPQQLHRLCATGAGGGEGQARAGAAGQRVQLTAQQDELGHGEEEVAGTI
jgi:hypothetical protein